MARESRFIEGVFLLENEEEGIEYLTFPETDWIWDETFKLGEADPFLYECLARFGLPLTEWMLYFHRREELEQLLEQWRAENEPEAERLLVRRDPSDGELVAMPESQARALDDDPEAELHAVEDQTAPELEGLTVEV